MSAVSVNMQMLQGAVGDTPHIAIENGVQVVYLQLVTFDVDYDADGKPVQQPTYHNIECHGRLAKVAASLKIGQGFGVQGTTLNEPIYNTSGKVVARHTKVRAEKVWLPQTFFQSKAQ